MIGLKRELVRQAKYSPFEIYKFVGDGWILLFEETHAPGPALIRLLRIIAATYDHLSHHGICAVLGITDHQVGLTFGIECGTLVKIVMNRKTEYVGRALNVAVRLQSAVGDCEKNPVNKVLISKNAYSRLKLHRGKTTRGTLVHCSLWNVAGGEHYHSRKLALFEEKPARQANMRSTTRKSRRV